MKYREVYSNGINTENMSIGNNTDLKALNITVKGRVQGVGFRRWAFILAKKLGVKGTVCNRRDYSVNIAAEADADTLKQFTDALKNKHPYAKVEELTSEEVTVKGYKEFSILYT